MSSKITEYLLPVGYLSGTLLVLPASAVFEQEEQSGDLKKRIQVAWFQIHVLNETAKENESTILKNDDLLALMNHACEKGWGLTNSIKESDMTGPLSERITALATELEKATSHYLKLLKKTESAEDLHRVYERQVQAVDAFSGLSSRFSWRKELLDWGIDEDPNIISSGELAERVSECAQLLNPMNVAAKDDRRKKLSSIADRLLDSRSSDLSGLGTNRNISPIIIKISGRRTWSGRSGATRKKILIELKVTLTESGEAPIETRILWFYNLAKEVFATLKNNEGSFVTDWKNIFEGQGFAPIKIDFLPKAVTSAGGCDRC